MKRTVSIIIPTYNESRNVKQLVPEIFRSCKALDASVEVVIVDDNSPDGTAKIAGQLARKFNVKVIRREGKLGLASAVIKGFAESKGSIIGAMDADLSHPPQVLPMLIEPLLKLQADVTVGSRYAKGGQVEVWPLHRKLISWAATLMARPLTKVKDPMSGLFFLNRKVIEGVKLEAKGYKIGLEIIVKGKYRKYVEVPYTFRNRSVGKSKMGTSEYLHYLRNLLRLYAYRLNRKMRRCLLKTP